MNISNYKFSPWHITKSISQSYDWERYFGERINRLNRIKERIKNSYGVIRQYEEKRLIKYTKEIEKENIKWCSGLIIICDFFNIEIDDVRTFISPNSSIFKIPIEEVEIKLQKLIEWIKDPLILKNLISTSELSLYNIGIETGIWKFNKDIDINYRFEKLKKYLHIETIDFIELAKIDSTYFKSLFHKNQYLENRISKLALTINLNVTDFISILHIHPYLIHVKPNKLEFNLKWMSECFNCLKTDLVLIMYDYPPVMYWYVSSLGDVFRSCGYSFSAKNKNVEIFRKVVVKFFEKNSYILI